MGTPDSHRAQRRVRLMNRHEKPAPVDLSHHFSAVTKRRTASKIKEAYKFFQIPGILNIAGGLPHADFFPFETLEAQAAKPERWTPSPNHPSESTAPLTSSSDSSAATHVTVPKAVDESNPLKKIDVTTALQYGLAQGYPPLLSWVRQFTRENLHPHAPYKGGPEVILTCGSTDGFSKALSLFVDQWTEGVNDVRERPGLLCEPFVYSNVLSQAQPFGVQPVTVKADLSGMTVKGPGGLEDVLANWDPSKGKRPNLMYTVTLGHNPTGIVLSVERKREIYAVCSKYDVIIVEDEPYWYLQFPSAATEEAKSRGQPLPSATAQPSSERSRLATTGHTHDVSTAHPVFFGSPTTTCAEAAVHPAFSTSSAKQHRRQQRSKQPTTTTTRRSSGYPFLDSLTPSFLALDTDGRVVRLDTFSKTVAPGCRLGWITAQPALIERFERISEATTQQPSGFVQGIISELVLGPSTPQNKNTAAKSAFARLLSSSPRQQPPAAFTGWDTSGWVRWLEGLRGSYERRMARMCRTLDSGATLITTSPTSPSSNSEWSPENVTKTPLYTFAWPRGGMFIWLRMHLETHPLWRAPFPSPSPNPKLRAARRVLDGPALSAALMVWLTTKPFLVLVATGSMFSANEEVRREAGWAYYRVCFAAEAEENVDRAAERFVEGVRAFWEVRDVRVVEKLLGELGMAEEGGVEGLGVGEDVVRLGSFMGC